MRRERQKFTLFRSVVSVSVFRRVLKSVRVRVRGKSSSQYKILKTGHSLQIITELVIDLIITLLNNFH